MATRRALIIAALVARVSTITVANGFETNGGELVFVGEASALGADDPDQALAVVIGDEDLAWQLPGKAFLPALPIAVRALAKADSDAAWMTVEALVGDIKRAMEVGDPMLGGLLTYPLERGSVQTLRREVGAETVGAAVTYRVRWKESWGAP